MFIFCSKIKLRTYIRSIKTCIRISDKNQVMVVSQQNHHPSLSRLLRHSQGYGVTILIPPHRN
ncbi:hypothetical protein Avbf_03101, partial [Armadillidium vulgare]